jgi:hypothetical protein
MATGNPRFEPETVLARLPSAGIAVSNLSYWQVWRVFHGQGAMGQRAENCLQFGLARLTAPAMPSQREVDASAELEVACA